MASIKISTGLKTYDIEDENGNVRGQISFNPSDINLYPRAQRLLTHFEEYTKEIDALGENVDDEAKIITEYDTKLKHELNELFDDENLSSVVFGNQHCLNTLNGVTFFERFFNAFLPVMERDINAEIKKSQKRISKYTEQVSK